MTKLFGLGILMAFTLSCRSTTPYSELSGASFESSYAESGAMELKLDYKNLLEKLDRYQTADEKGRQEILECLERWDESLSLYVHLFPSANAHDRVYRSIRENVSQGYRLLSDPRDPIAVDRWAQSSSLFLSDESVEDLFKQLNHSYASRRKPAELPSAYWEEVDFVPDLKGDFLQNLKDYADAQKKALGPQIRKADATEPLFPGHEKVLTATLDRLKAIDRFRHRYLPIETDPRFHDEVENSLAYYTDLMRDMKEYEKWKASGQETAATRLAQSIRKKWEERKKSGLSSPRVFSH